MSTLFDKDGFSHFWENLETILSGKQDKLTFDSEPTEGSLNPVTSNGIFQSLQESGGAISYDAVIGTTWTEDENTGIKSQFVAISGVLASHTAKVDHIYNGSWSKESFVAFVEAENQYLDCVTNGFAETVDGGINFYIFGEAPTVEIPIVVEVK